jgi:integrase
MEYLNRNELRRLLEVAYRTNRLHHQFLVTVFWCGSRVSETLELKGTDIRDGKIAIARKKGSVPTKQDVHVDSDPLFDGSPILTLAKERSGRLFRFTRYTVDKFIKRYCKVAGIPADKAHVHALKHTSAIVFWEASGGSLGLLQRHLGHKAASSSLIYLYESDSAKACAIMAQVRI